MVINLEEPPQVRVGRGYNWLTNHGPSFGLDVNLINPATLDIADIRQCVLGQASGATFGKAMAITNHSSDFEWAVSHGFMWTGFNDGNELNKAWRQLLGAPTKSFRTKLLSALGSLIV